MTWEIEDLEGNASWVVFCWRAETREKKGNSKIRDGKWGIGWRKNNQFLLIQKVHDQHSAFYVSNPLMSHVVFAILITENLVQSA